MIKLAVDVMGFENDIEECITACEMFKNEHHDVEIHLVGDLSKHINRISNNFKFTQTNEFITQNDTILNYRKKENSSIKLAAELLNNNEVDGLVSACNSSVFVFCLYSIIGLLPNVEKIAFMPKIPKRNGYFNMLDVGASIDVNEQDLFNFAVIANEIVKINKPNPVIKILNIATESTKGSSLQINANKLFEINKNKFNYQGFIESKILLDSDADIVVTDGFSGNIALKAMEGTAKIIGNEIKQEFKKPKNCFAALLSKKILKSVVSKFDYKKNAGAFVVGLQKPVVKTHGSADKEQFLSSLKMLYDVVSNNVLEKVKNKI